jgi:hypothetical protein
MCNCIAQSQVVKAPAYPLITHNPYFSIWSTSDKLNQSSTVHWTGTSQSLIGLIDVDGNLYRFLGQEPTRYKIILPTSEEENYIVKYTENKPSENWINPDYNPAGWSEGGSPIGNFEGSDKTLWKTHDIWIRRTFFINDPDECKNLYLKVKHDDGADIFLNGKKIYSKGGPTNFRMVEIDSKKLQKGENVLAIHVVNTGGGAFIDAGFLEKVVYAKDSIPEAVQTNLVMSATQTSYHFNCGSIKLNVDFTSPLLLQNLDLLGRPISYITFKVGANDNKSHHVRIFIGVSSDIAVNNSSQEVIASRQNYKELSFLKVGTEKQPVLEKKGDDLRIDWGYAYVAAPSSSLLQQYITTEEKAVSSFVQKKLTSTELKLKGKQLSLNTIISFEKVGSATVSKFVEIGYDERYSIQYFYQNLRPWWNNSGDKKFEDEMIKAKNDYTLVLQKSKDFDKTMYKQALQSGGENYANLCIIAYRQSIAAHQMVRSPKRELLWLSKENFSNGSINTVDVTYPSAPLYLLYNPKLLEGMLNGIFEYSESGKWIKDFPAHDLGKYPIANGQLYGEDMPVEEAGNMIILVDALTKAEHNAAYAKKHFNTITRWANYLLKSGFDPSNQLSTDDFAGHLAHNVNLSAKAIIAIGAYADLAKQLNQTTVALRYRKSAEQMVNEWIKLSDGEDHLTLVFGKPETWSQKYNLVWDKVLALKLFPAQVYNKEVSFYLKKQNQYGLPLDNRKTYTKADWITWTASLAEKKPDFDSLIQPLYKYAIETPSHVPMSDWYETTTGKMTGFQARSVVGGFFIKMLFEKF